MRLILLLFLLTGSVLTGAQTVSGRWEGNYNGVFGSIMKPEKLIVDLMVTDDTLLTGTSHLYYASGNYEHYRVTGYYHSSDSTVFFSEDSTISKSFSETCLGDYTLKLTVHDSVMRLSGRWRDNSSQFVLLRCPSSGVWLERKLPMQKPLPSSKPDKNLSRKAQVQSLIEVSSTETDSIKIELVDNAQIDNDVVSVYLNDSLVLSKLRLKATPETFYLSFPPDAALCRIKLAAESMGSVPPCTALMIVTTRQKQYRVLLSSDFGTNATLELFRKE